MEIKKKELQEIHNKMQEIDGDSKCRWIVTGDMNASTKTCANETQSLNPTIQDIKDQKIGDGKFYDKVWVPHYY